MQKTKQTKKPVDLKHACNLLSVLVGFFVCFFNKINVYDATITEY